MPDVPVEDESPSWTSTWFQETALDPHPSPMVQTDTVLTCQWLCTEAAFADTGGLVSGDELAELIRSECQLDALLQASQPVSLVARWLAFRKVVSIDSPWGPMLPLFQFDLPRAAIHPGVQLVLGELKGVLNDAELALWFVTPNEWLNGARPVQAVKTRIAAVQQAARTDRFVALGG